MIEIELKKIEQILTLKIKSAPDEVKKSFPKVLQKNPLYWIAFSSDSFFSLIFLNDIYKNITLDRMSKRLDSFPGLILDSEKKAPAAIKIDNSKSMWVGNCTVKNMYSFDLGKDSTVILENHLQYVKFNNSEDYEYKIDLAYIISFGNEINVSNLPQYFEELLTYSIMKWRQEHASKS
ncbi:MAG: hypothetical protein AB1500_03740 [Bacillota bacterium]